MVLLWYYNGNIMVLSTEEKRRESERKADSFVFSYKRILHNQKVFVILRAKRSKVKRQKSKALDLRL